MRNHQQQQKDQELMVSMDSQKNSNDLEATPDHHHVLPSPLSSSQDFKTSNHQHNIHVSKKTHEDEGFIFKNAHEDEGSQDFKKIHLQHDIHASKKINGNESFVTIKNKNYEVIKEPSSLSCSLLAFREGDITTPPSHPSLEAVVEESGRDRLMRHRVEMAGQVTIPDIWGHEDLLKDWIDCTVFDSSLGNNTIMSARAALVQERRSTIRIKN